MSETRICENCGIEMEDDGNMLCVLCEAEDEETYCEECGEPSGGFDLCDVCEQEMRGEEIENEE